MTRCRVCTNGSVIQLLELIHNPIANRFVSDASTNQQLFPLAFGQCTKCGLMQQTLTIPADEIIAPYEWITYNEPEKHLDDLVKVITQLPGISTEASICGITFKDDSTLHRFQGLGFERTWRLDPLDDLGISDPRSGIETIQNRLTVEHARALRNKYGAPSIVIARHILEHAYDAIGLMETLAELVAPDGYIVFEVPDCTVVLETLDYTTLWEEPLLYFTPTTFRYSFGFGNLAIERTLTYPYPYENS